jgi:hypothetical protein
MDPVSDDALLELDLEYFTGGAFKADSASSVRPAVALTTTNPSRWESLGNTMMSAGTAKHSVVKPVVETTPEVWEPAPHGTLPPVFPVTLVERTYQTTSIMESEEDVLFDSESALQTSGHRTRTAAPDSANETYPCPKHGPQRIFTSHTAQNNDRRFVKCKQEVLVDMDRPCIGFCWEDELSRWETSVRDSHLPEEEWMPCDRHGKMEVRTSRSAANNGRRYFGCPKEDAPRVSDTASCTVGFVWADERQAHELKWEQLKAQITASRPCPPIPCPQHGLLDVRMAKNGRGEHNCYGRAPLHPGQPCAGIREPCSQHDDRELSRHESVAKVCTRGCPVHGAASAKPVYGEWVHACIVSGCQFRSVPCLLPCGANDRLLTPPLVSESVTKCHRVCGHHGRLMTLEKTPEGLPGAGKWRHYCKPYCKSNTLCRHPCDENEARRKDQSPWMTPALWSTIAKNRLTALAQAQSTGKPLYASSGGFCPRCGRCVFLKLNINAKVCPSCSFSFEVALRDADKKRPFQGTNGYTQGPKRATT